MREAELLDTDMSGWCPVTQHYRVSDGDSGEVHFIAVTRLDFATASGRVEAFVCDENGVALSLTPLWSFDQDMTHDDALAKAGFRVINNRLAAG